MALKSVDYDGIQFQGFWENSFIVWVRVGLLSMFLLLPQLMSDSIILELNIKTFFGFSDKFGSDANVGNKVNYHFSNWIIILSTFDKEIDCLKQNILLICAPPLDYLTYTLQ